MGSGCVAVAVAVARFFVFSKLDVVDVAVEQEDSVLKRIVRLAGNSTDPDFACLYPGSRVGEWERGGVVAVFMASSMLAESSARMVEELWRGRRGGLLVEGSRMVAGVESAVVGGSGKWWEGREDTHRPSGPTSWRLEPESFRLESGLGQGWLGAVDFVSGTGFLELCG